MSIYRVKNKQKKSLSRAIGRYTADLKDEATHIYKIGCLLK